jgi:hypothetical protein
VGKGLLSRAAMGMSVSPQGGGENTKGWRCTPLTIDCGSCRSSQLGTSPQELANFARLGVNDFLYKIVNLQVLNCC